MNTKYNFLKNRNNLKVIDTYTDKSDSCKVDILEYPITQNILTPRQVVVYLNDKNNSICVFRNNLKYLCGNINIDVEQKSKTYVYSGTGMIVLEETVNYFTIVEIDESNPIIVDKRNVFAGYGDLNVNPIRELDDKFSYLTGNNSEKIKIDGIGFIILETFTSPDKMSIVELNDDILETKTNSIILRNSGIKFLDIRHICNDSNNSEDIMETYRGSGVVWLV